jgi:hypothetical protein
MKHLEDVTAVSTVARLCGGQPRRQSSIPTTAQQFLSSTASRAALWSIHPPIQLVQRALSHWRFK